jgi:hypothetical protein
LRVSPDYRGLGSDRRGFPVTYGPGDFACPAPTFTPEQIEAARVKYNAELREHLDAHARGEVELDQSDWPCGLEFVMATYSPQCWLRFFE